ncbi:MAG: MBL fold metallo-hydrolase RNA specificity domain-containing protein [Clostridiaceae bacterium]
MNIKFLGAAMSVTGTCFLVTTDKYKFLLDCGQFQGSKILAKLNFGDFGFDPAAIDFLILSHAHIDHCGRIPLLTNRGFRGKIYCTDATGDLVGIMLKDSGYIQEKEAEWENKRALRSGRPLVEPLFTVDDATESLHYLSPVLYDQMVDINPDIKLRFRDAGHILGAAIVELWILEGAKGVKVVFSGDLGMKNKPILRDPTIIEETDYLIMEATYGDRLHESGKESLEQFIQIILKTIKRGGTVVIPSFAVGRTQELIYELNMYYEKDQEFKRVMSDIMVYVDSPMATSATEVFRGNAQDFDDETREYILKGDNPLDFKNLKFTRSVEESKQLNFMDEPKIIISASGMCDAGRIKHHLKNNLWNEKSSIIIVGYQAEGTLGRSLVDGAKNVTIFGDRIHVNAEVYDLEGFSAHADKDELLEWLSGFKKLTRKIFLVHGEEGAKEAFAKTVKQTLGYDCIVVEDVSEYNLEEGVRISSEGVKETIDTGTQMFRVKDKLAQIHDEFDAILSNANLAAIEDISEEKRDQISNAILELEKTTIKLGELVTK